MIITADRDLFGACTRRALVRILMLTILVLLCQPAGSSCAEVSTKGLSVAPEAVPAAEGNSGGRETLRVAVVIGIDHYRYLPRLEFAGSDAEALAELLKAEALGHFDRVELLKDETGPVIRETLRRWAERLSAESTLVVYFSGHGMLGAGGRPEDGAAEERECVPEGRKTVPPGGRPTLLLLTRESRPACPGDTALSLDALRHLFDELPVHRKLLIVDACFNGQGRSIAPQGRWADASCRDGDCKGFKRIELALSRVNRGLTEQSHALLLAARPDTAALEAKPLGHGIYTYFLLKAICNGKSGLEACALKEPPPELMAGCAPRLPEQGAALNPLFLESPDTNGDGAISAYEAHDYARAWTMCATGEGQVPVGWFQQVGRQDVFLSGNPTGQPNAAINGLALETPEGVTIAIDRQIKKALPRVIPVAPGTHEVAVWDIRRRRASYGRVAFRSGESYTFDRLTEAMAGGHCAFEVRAGLDTLKWKRLSATPGPSYVTIPSLTVGSGWLRSVEPLNHASIGWFLTWQRGVPIGTASGEGNTSTSNIASIHDAFIGGLEWMLRSGGRRWSVGVGGQVGYRYAFGAESGFLIGAEIWQGLKLQRSLRLTLRAGAMLELLGPDVSSPIPFGGYLGAFVQPGIEVRR